MATTFVLQPDDYTAITFGVILPQGGLEDSAAISNYDMVLAQLQLNEEQRMQFEYAQYENREGGEWKETRSPLVPIIFTGRVVGLGGDLATRMADLLQRSAELMRAVTNSNGYLKYKPDGLAAGVMDTYYRYVQSTIPKPAMGETEYWGRCRATFGPTTYIDGVPTRQFEVTLMTHPFGLSDPDTPVLVQAATTLNDIDDGTNDHLTVTNAVVKGSIPALTRVLVHPTTANVAIDRLWIAKRIDGLASFVSTYNTAAAVDPTSVWSTVADVTRCADAYYRLTPVVNDAVYAMRYTIANWSSHRGRAAILAVIRNNGSSTTDFDIYYRWTIAHYPLTGEAKNSYFVEQWEPILLGEIDLPSTEMSELESLDLYIDICVVRRAGSTGTFDLDCIKLLYTDESAIQVDMPSGYGAGTTHDFLLENLDEEIAHVITHADQKLQYLANPFGDFITLEPDCDTRLDFAWRRRALDDVTDDASTYSQYWAEIEDFEVGDWDVSAYPYSVFCTVNWRALSASYPSFLFGYPTEITGGGWNTAALVTAGKMRADGNDLRVILNGVEAKRRLYGMNTAATKVWLNVPPLLAAPTLTISADISDVGEVVSITFNQAINTLPSAGYGRIIKIGNELFTYTTKNDATRTISGISRAQLGSSAAAHTSGDTAYWIQHDIRIVYGNANADPPAVADDAYRPAFWLNSTNEAWTYEDFGIDGQTRPGGWYYGGPSAWWYGGDHGAAASPWSELGMRVGPAADGTYTRRALHNPCGITNVHFTNGEKYKTHAGITWLGYILSSISSWIWDVEYTIAAPVAAAVWESWSRNEVLDAGKFYVALGLQVSGASASGYYACLESSDCVVTLDASYTPVVTMQSEVSADSTTYAVEGQKCQPIATSLAAAGLLTMSAPNPFLFVSTDFLCFYMHMTTSGGSANQSIRIRIRVDAANYYEKTIAKTQASGTDANYYEYHLLSSFATTGAPTWGEVTVVEFYCTTDAGACTFYFDDIRMSKADPDSAVIYNDTYDIWDFPSGTWHIYELASVTKTLGQIDNTANVEQIALLHTDYGGDNKFSAQCRAKRDAGHVGLVFRVSDGTSGSEDGYACYLDTADDLLRLSKFVAGVETVLASAAYTFDVDTDYYIGVFAKGTTVQCYVSTDETALWEPANMLIDTTDASHTTGQIGLITCNTLGRFTDITLEQSVDRLLPSDQIQVTLYAWFRTVYPFYEASA